MTTILTKTATTDTAQGQVSDFFTKKYGCVSYSMYDSHPKAHLPRHGVGDSPPCGGRWLLQRNLSRRTIRNGLVSKFHQLPVVQKSDALHGHSLLLAFEVDRLVRPRQIVSRRADFFCVRDARNSCGKD